MKRLDIDQPGARDIIAAALQDGSVVVLPTDTLYGFSALVTDRDARERIIEAKGGQSARRFICLADGVDMVASYVSGWGSVTRATLDELWPAPVTVVLPAGGRCPSWFGDTIAFRVPDDAVLRRLLTEVGDPVLSTSVNREGEPPLNEPDDIESAFGNVVDMIVVRRKIAAAGASTLVDCTVSPAKVLREGDYVWPGGGKPSK
jgi:L-threonylcarbamoyladenylate synthase